jgi:hypothetical protein
LHGAAAFALATARCSTTGATGTTEKIFDQVLAVEWSGDGACASR